MFAFLKRMVGQDPDATEAQRRFSDTLSKLETRREEMRGASAAIATIIQDVEKKNAEIALSKTITGLSGEYRMNLPTPLEIEEATDEQRAE